MGNDVTDAQAKWRDDRDYAYRNRRRYRAARVRMALGDGRSSRSNTSLARLPMEAKRERRVALLAGDLLLERGRDAEAKRELLHALMQKRGFYPMVAAQRLGEEYTLKLIKRPPT